MFQIKNGKQYRDETSRKISWGHWFAFFNILWAIAIGSRYAFIIDWPHTLSGKLYFFISLFGHFSFIIFAIYLLLIFPLSFVVKNHRTFRGISVILATIGCTLLLVDTEVFSRFHLHLSSVVWNLLVNPEKGELSRTWQIFFAPMPIILLAQMLFSRWSWEKLRSLERQRWLKFVGVFFVCAFTATHLVYAWSDAFIYRPITMQKSNFPLSYPMTARSFLESHGFLDKNQYSRTLEQEGRLDALKVDYPQHELVFAKSAVKPNIVLVTVSGLRYDSISVEKMPKLTALAEHSTQYLNHYSTGNQDNNGLTGIFYGLNANYTESLLTNQTPSVLIERLSDKATNYQIGVFSDNGFKPSLFRQSIFSQHKLSRKKKTSATTVDDFLQWHSTMALQNKAYFGYLDLHIEEGLNPTGYALALNKLDDLLSKLWQQVDSENTLLILTAAKGYYFDELNERQYRSYFAKDIIQVPMIVRWHALPIGKIEKLTSHTDLLPALMAHVFNVQNPVSDYAQGTDLFDLNGNRSWVLAGNYRWNVIITTDGTQYHLDRHGNYQKYDRTYEKQSSNYPPLGLFLDVFNQHGMFFEK